MLIPGRGIDVTRTFTCGQAFRWKRCNDMWFGVSGSKAVCITPQNDCLNISCVQEELPYWVHYLGLDKDYDELYDLLLLNEQTSPCLEYSRGIRLLRQAPFETLISFIISQNNNIQRISKIIEQLCMAYGQAGEHCGIRYQHFPRAEALSRAEKRDIEQLGAGYRAQYIIDAAKAALDFDFDALKKLDYHQAQKALMRFNGVGPKVADCVLLFSLDFDEAFPVDVWVSRVVAHLYPGENGAQAAALAARQFGTWAGAAQQYLFHYARAIRLGK